MTPVTYKVPCMEGWFRHAVWQWERNVLPSIFMPRWASRILLKVINISVERVQDIAQVDARKEGCIFYWYPGDGMMEIPGGVEFKPDCVPMDKRDYITGFRELWNSINAKRGYGWDVNPWVWVIEFKNITS